jgi:hypothetical protein
MKPVPVLPNVYIDTTFALPGGTHWPCHTSADLRAALVNSQPGDVIVLDAGATYSGNFTLSAKANANKRWIYIITNGAIPAPGVRVGPSDAAAMAKVVTPNTAPAFITPSGATCWRLVGLEVTSTSAYVPPGGSNTFSYFLLAWPNWPPVAPLADSITIDRCYFHADPTLDIQQATQITASNFAVVDSYIDDIHQKGVDSSGIGSNVTPGPVKIVNNYVSASSENIIFGGAGGGWGGNVPSDIEIRNNYLFKPLSWIGSGYDVKNAFECKSCQRVLFDGNTIENVWYANQLGYAVVLTVRTSQSGDVAVVDDITVTNNVLKNVVSFVNTIAADDQCGIAPYTGCHNSGSQARWNISNNLVLFFDPTLPGGNRNIALALQPGLNRSAGDTPPLLGMIQDVVFQHNTIITAASTPTPFASVWIGNPYTAGPPPNFTPAAHLTDNIWILDNVFTKQPTGDNGITTQVGLPWPNTAPDDLTARCAGNVILLTAGERNQGLPPSNDVTTTPPTFDAQYQLLTPDWRPNTSDHRQAGYTASTGLSAPTNLTAVPV